MFWEKKNVSRVCRPRIYIPKEKYYVGNNVVTLWKSRRWISRNRAGEEGEGVRQGDFGDTQGHGTTQLANNLISKLNA